MPTQEDERHKAEQEDPGERLDRELAELHQELRVALPGVEVLFGFQLALPFAQRFGDITGPQEVVYLCSFLATAVAVSLLIAPVAFHRLRWRQYDKDKLLRLGNRMLVTGLVFLAGSFAGMVFVVTDMILGRSYSAVISGGLLSLFGWLWFALPISRRLQKGD
jgi:uncharacterized membrane protein YgdD (TMEM256/DUF423 family)